MKKSFTFFAISALFLMLLFPVSVKADPIVKSFAIPNNGWNTSTSSQEACAGNISNQSNIINSGDFYWSGVYYSAAQRDDDAWTGIAKNTKCCSRQEVTFSASSYTISVITKWKGEEKTVNLPKIIINGNNYSVTRVVENSESQSFSNNQWGYARDNSTWQSKEVTLEYDVNLSSGGGNYTISLQTADDGNGGFGGDKDKYLFKTLTITPNCTQHTVTVAADDNNKGTVAGGGSYCENSEVTVTATPNANYSFTGWSSSDISIADASANPLVFTMPAKAVTVQANFVACSGEMVTVVANNADYGTVTGEGSYCAGSQVNLTATPNSGYRFVNWTVTSGVATLDDARSKTTHFVMSDPATVVTIQANFEEDIKADRTYTYRAVEDNTGHNTNAGQSTADYLYLTESEHYIDFTHYSATATTCTIKVGFIADNSKEFKVYVNDGQEKRNWTWNTTDGERDMGEFNLSAGNNKISIVPSYTWFGIRYIKVIVNESKYTVTVVNNDTYGTVTTASSNFAEEVVDISVEANPGYFFSGWESDDVTFTNASAESTTFTMPANAVTITANYEASVSSALTFSAVEGGSIVSATAGGEDISSGGAVVSGTSVTLTAGANSNYVFINWTDNNNSNAVVSTNAAFTFSMPATATSYTANFAQIDNVISQGSETGSDKGNSGGGASIAESHIADFDAFGHNVVKLTYSNMSGSSAYCGWNIGKSGSYNSASSAGATGFGFYYKTEAADDAVAMWFDPNTGNHADQRGRQLDATSNVWKYVYIEHAEANGWNHDNIIIYINGDQEEKTTAKASGAIYIADIAATTITSKPDIANYHYTNNRGGAMAVDDYGTLCLPMAGTIEGATLYSVAGKETGDINYLVLEDEGNTIVAGKPYITQSTATSYTVTMSGAHSAVQDGNGLEGTYVTIDPLTPYNESGPHNYFLYENAFKKAGDNVTVGAYRAYLNWDAVSAAPAQAPSARRIRMVIEGKEVQTGMETVTAMPKTTKVLIDGQLFIIREGKRYTLTGARAQ